MGAHNDAVYIFDDNGRKMKQIIPKRKVHGLTSQGDDVWSEHVAVPVNLPYLRFSADSALIWPLDCSVLHNKHPLSSPH